MGEIALLQFLYDHSSPKIRYYVDNLRYRLGWLPRVNPHQRFEFSPGKRAAIVISADLELAWAWRYDRQDPQQPNLAIRMAHQTRDNMPKLLELFDRYEIPVTWAIVGHLFLDGCELENGKAHSGMLRPPYFENEFWRYRSGDWYEHDPCSSAEQAPEWYAPDLIRDILSAKVKHEIACHTFSHIDCSDKNCSPELMDAELAECRRLAQEWGIDLKSFVFPGNLTGNLAA